MELKINVKMILDAYKKTGLKPVQCRFLDKEKTCGCALSALYLSEHDDTSIDGFMSHRIVYYFREKIGISNVEAFTKGFDGFDKRNHFCFEALEYYEVGKEAARQLGL